MDEQRRPRSREKKVVSEGKGVEKRGEGLGTGPVNNAGNYEDRRRGSRFSILLSDSSARSRERTAVSASETARSGREHRIPLMAPARHPVLPCLSVHVRTAEAPILSAAVRHRGSPARTVHARRPEITREAKDNTTAVSGRTVPEMEHSAHPEADPEWAEASCC